MQGGTTISTVSGQTGRTLVLVGHVQDAWRDIQLHSDDWLWMQAEFSGQTVASTQRYAGAAFSLTRFADWRFDRDYGQDSGVTCYLTATGVNDERPLYYLPWDEFYRLRLRGAAGARTGYPVEFTVDPARNLVLYPTPDAAYTVRGQYRKTPQELSADADVPELPVRWHDMIWLKALLAFGTFEETMAQLQVWDRRYAMMLSDLMRDQLPRMELGGPLA